MRRQHLCFSEELLNTYLRWDKINKESTIHIYTLGLAMNIDLDLDNYCLNDVLSLFDLPSDFTRPQLKNARSIALRLHPDKCHLDSKYYIFFSKAYNLLVEVLQFRERKAGGGSKNERGGLEMDQGKIIMLDRLTNTKDFSRKFNQLFEELGLSEKRTGHGEWISGESDVDFSVMERKRAEDEIAKRKANLRSLVPFDRISTISSSGSNGFNLGGHRDSDHYSCDDPFAKLKFEDLRVAHTETVIPVTEEDLNIGRMNTSVDMLQRERGTQDIKPLSQKESKTYLGAQQRNETSLATARAYELAKQDGINQSKTKEWWSRIQQLEDRI